MNLLVVLLALNSIYMETVVVIVLAKFNRIIRYGVLSLLFCEINQDNLKHALVQRNGWWFIFNFEVNYCCVQYLSFFAISCQFSFDIMIFFLWFVLRISVLF